MPSWHDRAVAIKAREGEPDHLQKRVHVLRGQVRRLHEECDRLQRIADARTEQVRQLFQQLSGDRDPTIAGHPGQVLLSLGWTYHPDDTVSDFDPDDCDVSATYWEDPECKGTGRREWHCLPSALNVAFRRFLGWADEGGPESAPVRRRRIDRLLEDDE